LEIIRTISWMKEQARQARAESRIIGLVPTMARCMLDTWRWLSARSANVRR